VAYEASAFGGLDTPLTNVLFDVALGTIVHFHPIPGVLFQTKHVFAPEITTVACDTVFLIHLHVIGCSNIPVTRFTGHLCLEDMGGMWEINTGGLLGIDQPGDFSFRYHIFLDELLLGLAFSQGFFMTLHAAFQGWNPCKRTILTKIVTTFTAVTHLVLMENMAEFNWLVFLGIQQFWENAPTDNEAYGKTDDKE
jgi:hypothetical protein